MSEFRQNYVNKEWVIIAPERSKRPDDMRDEREESAPLPPFKDDCPFCPGHEDRTPPASYSLSNGESWKLRVVPNKFAALSPGTTLERDCDGPFLRAGGFGVAEVLIESPRHDETLSTLSLADVEQVLRAFRTRHLALASDPRINLVTIFRNHGKLAGTSLEHPHSQIIATPIVPPHVRDPWQQAQAHFDTFGRCAYCEALNGEIRAEARILRESEHYVSFCPYASKSPFEIRIFPRRHCASFSWLHDLELFDLAYILKDALERLRVGLRNPDYNLLLRSCAFGDEDARHLHWYMVVIPKLTTAAGFELGTGIYINVTPPEVAAAYLRKVEIEL